MPQITFAGQTIEIDADLVAHGLRMDSQGLRAALQDGRVTRTLEKGEGDDAGRFRVTFYAPARKLRLTFTADGVILKTLSSDYSRNPRPPTP